MIDKALDIVLIQFLFASVVYDLSESALSLKCGLHHQARKRPKLWHSAYVLLQQLLVQIRRDMLMLLRSVSYLIVHFPTKNTIAIWAITSQSQKALVNEVSKNFDAPETIQRLLSLLFHSPITLIPIIPSLKRLKQTWLPHLRPTTLPSQSPNGSTAPKKHPHPPSQSSTPPPTPHAGTHPPQHHPTHSELSNPPVTPSPAGAKLNPLNA